MNITSVEIRADGWSADVTIASWAAYVGGVDYNFADFLNKNGSFRLTCNSQGFAQNKASAQTGRTIFATDVIRLPGVATLDETTSSGNLVVRVSLSDEIYQDDTNVVLNCGLWANNGTADNAPASDFACANSSAKPYPLPIAMWLTHDLDFSDGPNFSPKLAVGHKFGRSKSPVACVDFIASDGSNQVSALGSQSWTAYSASGLTAPHFSPNLPLAGLNAGLVTVDAVIYPWIGEAFTISTQADTYPSPNLCVLKFINNAANGYGRSFAYVDSVAGSDGSGVASSVQATASANRFATMSAALTAARSYNNSNYSRDNLSGATLILAGGPFTHASISGQPVGDAPLVISGETRTVVYRDAGSTTNASIPGKLKFKNITLQKNVNSNVTFLDSNAGSGSSNILITEDVVWSTGGHSNTYAAWIYRVGRWYEVNCSGAKLGAASFFGTVNKNHISIGSTGMGIGSATYHACASLDLSGSYNMPVAAAARVAAAGGFLGWCHLNSTSGSAGSLNMGRVIDSRGLLLAGTVFEKTSSATPAGVSLNADNDLNQCSNVVFVQCTSVGARANVAYQDTGSSTVYKELFKINSVFNQFNIKGDLFPTANAARFGNWAAMWNCGSKNNVYLAGSSAGQYGNNSWLGQVPDVGSLDGTSGAPLAAHWVLDASFTGTNAGGGDYTPQVSSQLKFVPASELHYPVDLKGNLAGAGTYSVGAVNISFDEPSGGNARGFFLRFFPNFFSKMVDVL